MFDGKALGLEIVSVVKTHMDKTISPLVQKIGDIESVINGIIANKEFEGIYEKLDQIQSEIDLTKEETIFQCKEEIERVISSETRFPVARMDEDTRSALREEILPIVKESVSVAILGVEKPIDGKDGAPGLDGKDGAPGRDGKDGAPGRNGAEVISSIIDNKGHLILSLDNGNLIDVGLIVGKNGKDGMDGEHGLDGINGKDGAPGLDGKDGAPGRDGVDGKDGAPGLDGKDGAPGLDGKDGAPGRDGVDGKDGKDGAPGLDGKDGAPGRDGTLEEFAPDDVSMVVAEAVKTLASYTSKVVPSTENKYQGKSNPDFHVHMPPVNISLPEQQPPVVNMAAPVVNVSPPQINVEAPKRGKEVTRVTEWDKQGRIKAFEKREEED